MCKCKIIVIIFIILIESVAFSQDLNYAKKIIDTLSSETMKGRGTAENGDSIAALFIKNEFIKNNVKPLIKDYYQNFYVNTNTFTDVVKLKINKKELKPVNDFLVSSDSPELSGVYKTIYLDSVVVCNAKKFNTFKSKKFFNKIIIIDKAGISDTDKLNFIDEIISKNPYNAKAFAIVKKDKIYWGGSKSYYVNRFAKIDIYKNSITDKIKTISVNIKNNFVENHKTQNIISKIEGLQKSDTFIVFTAHYDHLGKFGKNNFFPGANDNASGIAMLLDLAKYYFSTNEKPKYSVVFIAFTGEEIGLKGSNYFANNPLIDLKKIKFLINLDLVGNGEGGIAVVNGNKFEKQFNKLDSINLKYKLLSKVLKKGESSSSDHYPFYKNGVPCFFIYSMGGKHEYHNLLDNTNAITLKGYNQLFELLIKFEKSL